MRKRAAALDAAASELVDGFREFQDLGNRVARLTSSHGFSGALARIHMRKALAAAFGPVLDIDRIPPGQRRTLVDWVGQVQG